jgi:hypothetical protein
MDIDMAIDAVGGEPGEPFEISGLDGQDKRGLDGEVEACVIKVVQFVSV